MADDFHDRDDARRHRARLRRQRIYQAQYRSNLRTTRAPQKSDFASACFEELLTMLAQNSRAAGRFVERFTSRLTTRFDGHAVADRLAALVKREAAKIRRSEAEGH